MNRLTVGRESGIIRGSPTTVWDFETDPDTFTLVVRGSDFPDTPALSLNVSVMVRPHARLQKCRVRGSMLQRHLPTD